MYVRVKRQEVGLKKTFVLKKIIKSKGFKWQRRLEKFYERMSKIKIGFNDKKMFNKIKLIIFSKQIDWNDAKFCNYLISFDFVN